MGHKTEITKLGLAGSFLIYIPASVLLYVVTKYLVPLLSRITGQEPVLFWFITGGLLIFVPLIITGLVILKAEGYRISGKTITGRLRFRKITLRDFTWCIAGVIAVGLISMSIICSRMNFIS